MSPEFSQVVNPVFHEVLRISETIDRATDQDLRRIRAEIEEELGRAEKRAAQFFIDEADFDLARTALVFWADEILTVANHDWEDHKLEWHSRGTADRAWDFYVLGEEKARYGNADVAEVWYLALVLGFEGDIEDAFLNHLNRELPGGPDPEQAHEVWARELAARIRHESPPDQTGEAISGGVPPLTGISVLQIAVAAFLLMSLLFVFLLTLRLK